MAWFLNLSELFDGEPLHHRQHSAENKINSGDIMTIEENNRISEDKDIIDLVLEAIPHSC